MAPPPAALAQSESKARFFERLGLDEKNEQHRRLYARMKVKCRINAPRLSALYTHTKLGRSSRRS